MAATGVSISKDDQEDAQSDGKKGFFGRLRKRNKNQENEFPKIEEESEMAKALRKRREAAEKGSASDKLTALERKERKSSSQIDPALAEKMARRRQSSEDNDGDVETGVLERSDETNDEPVIADDRGNETEMGKKKEKKGIIGRLFGRKGSKEYTDEDEKAQEDIEYGKPMQEDSSEEDEFVVEESESGARDVGAVSGDDGFDSSYISEDFKDDVNPKDVESSSEEESGEFDEIFKEPRQTHRVDVETGELIENSETTEEEEKESSDVESADGAGILQEDVEEEESSNIEEEEIFEDEEVEVSDSNDETIEEESVEQESVEEEEVFYDEDDIEKGKMRQTAPVAGPGRWPKAKEDKKEIPEEPEQKKKKKKKTRKRSKQPYKKIDPADSRARRRRFWFWVLVCLVLLLGIGGGITIAYFLSDDDNGERDIDVAETTAPSASAVTTPPTSSAVTTPPTSTPLPTSAPTQRTLLSFLCGALPENCDALQLADSPQNRAFQWLEENSRIDTYDDETILTRYALATLFFSTGGENAWADSTNWLSPVVDACQWYSTSTESSCDGGGTFVRLVLNDNGLNGSIPPEVGLLQNLVSLSIQSSGTNVLSGPLPDSLGRLDKVVDVTITGNQLSGGIPEGLGGWSAVETIDLSGNGLSGPLPAGFGPFPSLRTIDLSDNAISGAFPATSLSQSSNVVTINLSQNQLTSLPDEIAQLPSLRNLFVADNSLSSFPLAVTQLGDLTRLDLSNNGFGGAISSEIGGLEGLSELRLSSNGITGTIPTELFRLTRLQRALDLSANSLSGPLPTQIGLLTNLRRLYIEDNSLNGNIPGSLSNLSDMTVIRIDGNEFSGIVPRELCTLYNDIQPYSFADCNELAFADCFLFCCDDGDCTCRLLDTPNFGECFAAP